MGWWNSALHKLIHCDTLGRWIALVYAIELRDGATGVAKASEMKDVKRCGRTAIGLSSIEWRCGSWSNSTVGDDERMGTLI